MLKMTVGFWSPHVRKSLQLEQLANDFDATDKSGSFQLGDLTNLSPELKPTDTSEWQVSHEIVKWRFFEWSTRPEEKFYGQLAFKPPFKGKVAVLKYDENKFAKRITDARMAERRRSSSSTEKFAGVEKKRPDAVAEMPPDKPWCCFCRAADKSCFRVKSPDEEKDAANEDESLRMKADAADEPPLDKEPDSSSRDGALSWANSHKSWTMSSF